MLAHKISDLIRAPAGTTQMVVIDEPVPDLGPELELDGPLHGRARLHRTQRGVVVQAEVRATVELQCSRCLEPFLRPVALGLEEEFVLPAEHGGPVDEDNGPTFEIDEHHVLDLTDAVRQYLTMELPLAPLCRSDCPGLCPVCGAPLMDHLCPYGADAGSASNPFAALRNLLPDGPLKAGDD